MEEEEGEGVVVVVEGVEAVVVEVVQEGVVQEDVGGGIMRRWHRGLLGIRRWRGRQGTIG